MTEKKPKRAHRSYTDEFKQQLVLLYQNGKRKYNIDHMWINAMDQKQKMW